MDDDRFIVEYNIRQFRAQLARELDSDKRRVLESLIAEQEAKLAGGGRRPTTPKPDLRSTD